MSCSRCGIVRREFHRVEWTLNCCSVIALAWNTWFEKGSFLTRSLNCLIILPCSVAFDQQIAPIHMLLLRQGTSIKLVPIPNSTTLLPHPTKAKQSQDGMSSANSHWETTMNFMASVVPLEGPPPPDKAPVATKLRYLHAQLSSINSSTVVLKQYQLNGPHDRCQGGELPIRISDIYV